VYSKRGTHQSEQNAGFTEKNKRKKISEPQPSTNCLGAPCQIFTTSLIKRFHSGEA